MKMLFKQMNRILIIAMPYPDHWEPLSVSWKILWVANFKGSWYGNYIEVTDLIKGENDPTFLEVCDLLYQQATEAEEQINSGTVGKIQGMSVFKEFIAGTDIELDPETHKPL